LLSIGNFSDKAQNVKLLIDWKALGMNPDKCRIVAPEIENFQPAKTINPNDPIMVEARKGWLIYLENII